ncbi:MAG TPA: LPS export ABC transporter periplasmic protein LptC [Chitinophagaceae bacterium]|nr:LPS export ABC transporter periplasmic protein LptC [Chitinophagaceae bacterium]
MKWTGIYFYAALLSGCIFIYSCENDPEVIKKFTEKKTAIEEAKNIESYLSQDGRVRAKLTAPYMLRYLTDSTYVEFPNSLHVDFYNDTLAVESQLDALYGKYREWEKKVFLRDSVVVINKMTGDTLRSPDLWWDQHTEKIYTDKPVRIHTRDKIIFGQYGLIASQDFSEYVINQAKGEFTMPKDSFP